MKFVLRFATRWKRISFQLEIERDTEIMKGEGLFKYLCKSPNEVGGPLHFAIMRIGERLKLFCVTKLICIVSSLTCGVKPWGMRRKEQHDSDDFQFKCSQSMWDSDQEGYKKQ